MSESTEQQAVVMQCCDVKATTQCADSSSSKADVTDFSHDQNGNNVTSWLDLMETETETRLTAPEGHEGKDISTDSHDINSIENGNYYPVVNITSDLSQNVNQLTIHEHFPIENDQFSAELTLHPSQNDLDIVEEAMDKDADCTVTNEPPIAIDDNQCTTQEFSQKVSRRRRHQYQRQFMALHPPSRSHHVSISSAGKRARSFRYGALQQPGEFNASSRAFMFLAIQSDPDIMYRDNMLSFNERQKRSIESTCGMTVVCLDSTDPLNLRSEGLCTRTQWTRVDKNTYLAMRSRLVFRDKFCNFRNFLNMKPYVKWPNPSINDGSLHRSFNRLPSKDHETITRQPIIVNSMHSSYKFRPIAEFSHATVMPLTTKLHSVRLQRFSAFYRELLHFIVERADGARQIKLYHRLPQNMLWLTEDMRLYANSLENPVILDFIKLSARASNPGISAHCIYRNNHNTVTCEICLFEAYLPQFLGEIDGHDTG